MKYIDLIDFLTNSPIWESGVNNNIWNCINGGTLTIENISPELNADDSVYHITISSGCLYVTIPLRRLDVINEPVEPGETRTDIFLAKWGGIFIGVDF